jgi:hypothetical protein
MWSPFALELDTLVSANHATFEDGAGPAADPLHLQWNRSTYAVTTILPCIHGCMAQR